MPFARASRAASLVVHETVAAELTAMLAAVVTVMVLWSCQLLVKVPQSCLV